MLRAAMRQNRFLLVTKLARNHLGTDRASPHLVLLSPHREFHTAPGMPAAEGRWGNGGVKNKKGLVAYASLICVSTVAGCVGVVFDGFRLFSHAGFGTVASWFTAAGPCP